VLNKKRLKRKDLRTDKLAKRNRKRLRNWNKWMCKCLCKCDPFNPQAKWKEKCRKDSQPWNFLHIYEFLYTYI